jgi:hypothetical protein
MKILVNGYTVAENLKIKVNRFSKEELKTANLVLEHIKKNRKMYIKVVLLAALLLNYNMNFIFANELEASLDSVGFQFIEMFNSLAKWACIGVGIFSASTTLVSGGNMKDAIMSGLQYLVGYLFIQLYPQFFTMFAGIKF